MSTVLGVSGLFGIIMGKLTDKYGARILIAIGALIGGLSYWLMSDISSLWQLYLYFGIGVGVCIGSCYTPINATVSKWFLEKRALAIGITLVGISAGSMLLPPLVTYIITTRDWHNAYIMLSIIVCITAVPAVALLGRKPQQPAEAVAHDRTNKDKVEDEVREDIQPRQWSATEAAKTAPFWMLMITGFVTSASFYFVTVHIVAYATDVGISVTAAVLILTLMNIGCIAGSLLAWLIAIRLGNRVTLLLLLAAQALAMLLLIWATSLWLIFTLVLVFGFGFGATMPIRLAMISQLFGIRSVGTMLGILSFGFAVGGIIGPVLAGYIFDVSRSYDIAFLAGGLLIIIGTLAVCFLGGSIG
jgi:MFS family permease